MCLLIDIFVVFIFITIRIEGVFRFLVWGNVVVFLKCVRGLVLGFGFGYFDWRVVWLALFLG